MKIYTTEDVAEILQVKQITVQRFLASGTIKGFKIGKNWRVEEKDLQAYIEKLKGGN